MEVKYRGLVKVGNLPGGKAKVVRYDYINDLVAFTRFLDKGFPSWTWMNIYNQQGEKLAQFTTYNRPVSKKLNP